MCLASIKWHGCCNLQVASVKCIGASSKMGIVDMPICAWLCSACFMLDASIPRRCTACFKPDFRVLSLRLSTPSLHVLACLSQRPMHLRYVSACQGACLCGCGSVCVWTHMCMCVCADEAGMDRHKDMTCELLTCEVLPIKISHASCCPSTRELHSLQSNPFLQEPQCVKVPLALSTPKRAQ